MPPFRGQGMCSGLKDAANLCWKVATALEVRGGAPGAVPRPPRARAPAPAPAPAALPPALEALLDSYVRERAPHLRATTAIALAIGPLAQLRRPAALRVGRNWLLWALSRFPATRPFLLEPFAPPRELEAGWLDLHAPGGRRAWGDAHAPRGAASAPRAALEAALEGVLDAALGCDGGGGGARRCGRGARGRPLEGWRSRESVVGRSLPCYTVELTNDGAALRLPLDDLLQPTRGARAPAAPLWHLIAAPSTSGTSAQAGHPLMALRAAREAGAGARGGALLSLLAGVQLLPVVGAPSRIARHATRCGGPRAARPPAQDARGAYVQAVYAPVRAAAAADAASAGAGAGAGGALFHGVGAGACACARARAGGACACTHTAAASGADVEAADSSGRLAAWFAAAAGDCAIVRPDRVVYGVYTREELPGALAQLRVLMDAAAGEPAAAEAEAMIQRRRAPAWPGALRALVAWLLRIAALLALAAGLQAALLVGPSWGVAQRAA